MKNYRANKQLIEYVESRIKNMQFEEQYKEVIVDIILRRAYQYELSLDAINQDLDSLEHNLYHIIMTKSQIDQNNVIVAEYCAETKTIYIDINRAAQSKEYLYQTLTHEIYHVLSCDKAGVDKLSYKNDLIEKVLPEVKCTAIKEAIIEKSSYRVVYACKNNPENFNRNATTYSEIIFLIDLIEAVYGVTEQDLLKHAIMGRDRLIKFLSQKADESPEKTIRFLNELDVGGCYLYLAYENANLKKDQDKIQMIGIGLNTVIESCENKLMSKLLSKRVDNIEEAKLFKEEVSLELIKIQNIILNRMNYFKKDLDFEFALIITKRVNNNLESLQNYITKMDMVVEDYKKFNQATKAITIFNNLNKFPKQYLINAYGLTEKGKLQVSKKYLEKVKEDDCYSEKWNNQQILDYLWEKSKSIYISETISNIKMQIKRKIFNVTDDSIYLADVSTKKLGDKQEDFEILSTDNLNDGKENESSHNTANNNNNNQIYYER